jgi:hypothetical protein
MHSLSFLMPLHIIIPVLSRSYDFVILPLVMANGIMMRVSLSAAAAAAAAILWSLLPPFWSSSAGLMQPLIRALAFAPAGTGPMGSQQRDRLVTSTTTTTTKRWRRKQQQHQPRLMQPLFSSSVPSDVSETFVVASSSPTPATLDALKEDLVRACKQGKNGATSLDEIQRLVRDLEDTGEQLGIGQASSLSGLLSGEWYVNNAMDRRGA